MCSRGSRASTWRFHASAAVSVRRTSKPSSKCRTTTASTGQRRKATSDHPKIVARRRHRMPTAAAAMPTAAATVPTATAAVPTAAAAMPTAVAAAAMPTAAAVAAAAMAAAAMSGESDSGKGQCRGQCRDKCQFTKLHRHSSSSPAAWKASNQSGGSKAPRVSPSKTGVAASCIQTPHVLTTQQLTSAESDVHPPFRKNDLLRGQEPTALFFAAPGFRPPRREADHRLARQARGAYGAAGPCPVRPETVTLTDNLSVTA